MKLGDEYGSEYGQDDEAELRRRLMSSYAPDPAEDPAAGGGAGAAPVEAAPFNEAPQDYNYQPSGDAPGSTNESYQPPPEAPQAGFSNPEPPQRFEGADVTGGNPPALGAPAAGPASYSPVLGWDTGKLNSPDAQSEKYQFMRAVQAAGLNPIDATNNPQSVANAVNQMYPGLNVTANADGTINWPGLGPIDFSIDSGKGGWFFDPINERGQAGPAATRATATAATGRQTSAPTSFTAPGGSGGMSAPGGLWSSEFLGQLRQMLLSRIAAAGQPIDENASGINQALTGARDEATRSSDRERTALAERLYAQGGLNTDAIGQQVQQSSERTGTALGTLRAQLIMKELSSKREELNSLLQLAIQSGDAESARMVQAQLAELQAQIVREGYGVNMAIFAQNQNAQAGNPGSLA